MRRGLALLYSAVLLSVPSVAAAQEDEDCPPGGWFCEEAEPTDVEPGEVEEPAGGPEAEGRHPPPPVVVYQPEGEGRRKITIVDEPEPAPKKRRRRWRREWGFNLRLEGVMLGDDEHRHPDSGMGGLGFSFRYRPVPHFAFDAGLDFVGGTDWQGNQRSENALLLNGIIFFNPKDKFQLYALGGIGFSGARVIMPELQTKDADGNTTTTPEEERRYSYFGGQLGFGVEWRVGKKTAINVDVVGFVRGRTDENARYEPEFRDPDTGRTTNTSGGGLFRGGITFYW